MARGVPPGDGGLRRWNSGRCGGDAEVNLSRILVAAHDAFAEHGYEASMEEIAMRADAAWGALYRRFPNKADLLDAVVVAAHERKRQIAEAVLADVAPEDGVFEFVRRCIAVPSCWRATIAAPPWRTSGTGLGQTAPLLGEVLERSQRAGSVRPDVEVADIVVVIMAVRSIADVCDTKSLKPSLRFSSSRWTDCVRATQATPSHP